MSTELSVVSLTAQVSHTCREYGVADVRERLSASVPGVLTVNALASQGPNVVLQSPTSSTMVIIQPNQLQLTTTYYDKFVAPSEGGLRRAYHTEKFSTALSVVEKLGGLFGFCGFGLLARVPADQSQLPELRRKLLKALRLDLDAIAEGDCVDFALRVGWQFTDDAYGNLNVNPYEERGATIQAGQMLPMINEWDLPIVGSGIEFRCDWNNKLGLRKGKRVWSSAELVELSTRGLESFDDRLARIWNTARSMT
jgi:hypothetical protein